MTERQPPVNTSPSQVKTLCYVLLRISS